MKTFFYCLLAFTLGAAITALLGWRLFVGTVQMAELSNIRIHSQTLKLLEENDIKTLTQLSCFAIRNGLEYYENDLSKWFLAIENARGSADMTAQFLRETKKQIENEEVCMPR